MYKRTFNTTRLYHQLLKPKSVHVTLLPLLVDELVQAAFIVLVDTDRYSENEKFSEPTKQSRTQLFKIVQKLKDGNHG